MGVLTEPFVVKYLLEAKWILCTKIYIWITSKILSITRRRNLSLSDFRSFLQGIPPKMTISYACSMFLWHKVWTKTRMTQWKASQPVLNGHIIVSYRFVALKTNAKRSKYKKNEKKNQSSDIRFRTCTYLYCNSNWLCSQYEIQIEIKMCQIEKNVGTIIFILHCTLHLC